MTIPKVKYTFNTVPVGTSAANSIPIAGWATYGQGGNASESIIAGTETNRMRAQSESGLWATCFKTDQTYTEADFTVVVDTGFLYVYARCLIDSAVAPTGFAAAYTPSTGDIGLYKVCGGQQYSVASFSVSPFSSPFKVRTTMVGYVLSAYLNDVFIGSYDFTGNVLCGFDGPTSGYVAVNTFNNTITFDPGDKTPSYVLMSEV